MPLLAVLQVDHVLDDSFDDFLDEEPPQPQRQVQVQRQARPRVSRLAPVPSAASRQPRLGGPRQGHGQGGTPIRGGMV